jgi:RNA polymerase sigma factor (sigma-70 family)
MPEIEQTELDERVRQAQSGDALALEQIVRAVQDDVFDLALRMMGDATDAQDAAQEVLVRVVTKLSSFRGESAFRTWVYRLAANALLNFRGETRRKETSFDEAEAQLRSAIAAGAGAAATAPDAALVNEVKLIRRRHRPAPGGLSLSR